MNKKIFKYKLEPLKLQCIQMPFEAEVLTAQVQGADDICIWALVDPSNDLEDRFFEIVPTGQTPGDEETGVESKYISTVQLQHRTLVFHIFEVKT